MELGLRFTNFAEIFGPRRSDKADHIESKGGVEESIESSWKNDDLR